MARRAIFSEIPQRSEFAKIYHSFETIDSNLSRHDLYFYQDGIVGLNGCHPFVLNAKNYHFVGTDSMVFKKDYTDKIATTVIPLFNEEEFWLHVYAPSTAIDVYHNFVLHKTIKRYYDIKGKYHLEFENGRQISCIIKDRSGTVWAKSTCGGVFTIAGSNL